MGRVDYPCVSGALRDVYNGVETPPFKPYLYTHVREEKRQFWLVSVKRYTYLYTHVREEKLLLVAANREKRDIHTRACAGRNALAVMRLSWFIYDPYTRVRGEKRCTPISIVSTRDIHTRTSRGGEVAVVL